VCCVAPTGRSQRVCREVKVELVAFLCCGKESQGQLGTTPLIACEGLPMQAWCAKGSLMYSVLFASHPRAEPGTAQRDRKEVRTRISSLAQRGKHGCFSKIWLTCRRCWQNTVFGY